MSAVFHLLEAYFFLFFNLTQRLLLCILLFLAAEAGRRMRDETFSTNLFFLLNVSIGVGVTGEPAAR